jgi:hypothetical protein
MKRLDAAYLQKLVRALSGRETVPTRLRNECHRLMMAIDGNTPSLIEECVSRIQELARHEGFPIPSHSSSSFVNDAISRSVTDQPLKSGPP